MAEPETINSNDESVVSNSTDLSTEIALNKKELDQESLQIINRLIADKDTTNNKDLTYLFNVNQNKKTMIRVNKLNELLDVITDQTMTRFTRKPDEISNQELLQGLKIVQDIMERGQRQVTQPLDTPLIQINQQNNEINLGGDSMSAESKEKVRQAVLQILAGVTAETPTESSSHSDIIEVDETPEIIEDDQ